MSFDALHLGAAGCGAQSERLRLRALAAQDAAPLFEATRHPHFNQHLMWDAPGHAEAVQQRVDRIMQRAASGVCVAWSVAERGSGRWAALFRFEPREEAGWAEMGLWSHPAFWGAGHGEELTRLAMDQAFLHSRLDAVIACAKPAHIASHKLLERCGLEPFDEKPRRHKSGHEVLLVELKLTRERWERHRPPTHQAPITRETAIAAHADSR
jgi:RimJ/RimL family protein N-acetyltransferase